MVPAYSQLSGRLKQQGLGSTLPINSRLEFKCVAGVKGPLDVRDVS